MTSGTLTTAVLFVWMLNILMIFSQLVITDMTTVELSTTAPHFLDCNGTIMSSYSTDSDCTALSGTTVSNLSGELPGGAVPNSLFSTVDWITSTTSWIGKQINTFTQVVEAPKTMIMSIPMFREERYAPFASIIGVMWWAISLLLIVAFIFGR